MKVKAGIIIGIGAFTMITVIGLGQPPLSGPGVQAAQDAREPEVLKTCKTPPSPARGFGGPGRGAFPPPSPVRDYTITAIPDVVAAGEEWYDVWQETGNNDDGIVGTKDGGVLIAQNDKSQVVKVNKKGMASVAYSDTNTGGALSMSKKGVLFLASRGLNAKILELSPKRRVFADKYAGDSFDCIGGVLNDVMADAKGGVYFTMGGVFYANANGVVTQYGTGLRTNGLILSRDEKTLYVTNGSSLAAFDVEPDGSLVNQREFVKWEGGGGDGSAIDATGRIYVTTNEGIRVIGPDGHYLGLIPTPQGVVTIAFGGPGKKTLYAAEFFREEEGGSIHAPLIALRMRAPGYMGRAK